MVIQDSHSNMNSSFENYNMNNQESSLHSPPAKTLTITIQTNSLQQKFYQGKTNFTLQG